MKCDTKTYAASILVIAILMMTSTLIMATPACGTEMVTPPPSGNTTLPTVYNDSRIMSYGAGGNDTVWAMITVCAYPNETTVVNYSWSLWFWALPNCVQIASMQLCLYRESPINSPYGQQYAVLYDPNNTAAPNVPIVSPYESDNPANLNIPYSTMKVEGPSDNWFNGGAHTINGTWDVYTGSFIYPFLRDNNSEYDAYIAWTTQPTEWEGVFQAGWQGPTGPTLSDLFDIMNHADPADLQGVLSNYQQVNGTSVFAQYYPDVEFPMTPPRISQPANAQYIQGEKGHSITWYLSDIDPWYYNITCSYMNQQGALVQSGLWTSFMQSITYNLDTDLTGPPGKYTYTLFAYEYDGSMSFSTVVITVIPEQTPQFTQTPPSSVYYQSGEPSEDLTWTATNQNPSTYTITTPGGVIASGNWSSGNPIMFPIPNLSGTVGIDTYTCTVFNLSNLNASNSVTVYVGAPTLNTVTISSPSTTYKTSQSSVSVEFDVTLNVTGAFDPSLSGNIVKICVNNGLNSYQAAFVSSDTSGNYYYKANVTLSTSAEPYNVYALVGMSGTNSVSQSNTISLNVEYWVFNSPVFTSVPGSITYEYGTTGNTLTWQFGDAYPDKGSYQIWYAPTSGPGAYEFCTYPGGSGSWTNSAKIQIKVDGLPATTWAFYCAVTDNYGNSASSPYTTVKVYYAAPTFTGTQGNINVNPGQSFTLSWTATDGAPTTYTITCNGATLKSGQSWTSGTPITYQGSQSSLGSYTYTITVYDASGSSYSSSSSATVTVWLFTSTQPNIYAGLGVQFTLSWTAKASNPTTYTITCNGAQVAGGSWKSGVPINLPQTLNKAGTYTYTITVNSSQGSSSISCTVTVRVVKGQ